MQYAVPYLLERRVQALPVPGPVLPAGVLVLQVVADRLDRLLGVQGSRVDPGGGTDVTRGFVCIVLVFSQLESIPMNRSTGLHRSRILKKSYLSFLFLFWLSN